MVFQLNEKIEVAVMGSNIELPLSYADGMIGAVPVFDTKKAAEEFAGDKYKIAQLTIGEI
jgi:hypothetical protein